MGFEKPLQELDLVEIVRRTFNLYFSRFWLFFVPFLVAGLITGGWGKVVSTIFPMPVAPSPAAPSDVLLSYLASLIGNLLVTIFLTVLVGWIISTIVSGMTVKTAANILEKRDVDLSETLSYTTNRLPSLLAAGIITGLLIGIGLVALLVPGIILAIMFSLIVPAIIIEQAGALESLTRSRRLVGRRWLKTFGLLLIIGIIIVVATSIFTAISSLFAPADWIINGLLSALVSPLLPIALTFYYYAMVAREQTQPAQSTPPPTPPTPISPSEPS